MATQSYFVQLCVMLLNIQQLRQPCYINLNIPVKFDSRTYGAMVQVYGFVLFLKQLTLTTTIIMNIPTNIGNCMCYGLPIRFSKNIQNSCVFLFRKTIPNQLTQLLITCRPMKPRLLELPRRATPIFITQQTYRIAVFFFIQKDKN